MSVTGTIHITDVGTVGVPVRNQSRALEFYRDKLGFEIRMDGAYGDNRWIEVAPPGATTTVALVQAGAGDQTGVDTGLRLSTQDAAADHAALLARGVDVDAEIMAFPVPMFTLRDADANRLYIVERPAGI